MNSDYIMQTAASAKAQTGGMTPFEAAGALGAKIAYKDLGNLKGAYFGNFSVPVIVINEALDENMKKIVCAHELGHHLLHRGSLQSCLLNLPCSKSKAERDANLFAAAYLIDTDAALRLLSSGYSAEQVAAMLETDINLLGFLLFELDLADAPCGNFLK